MRGKISLAIALTFLSTATMARAETGVTNAGAAAAFIIGADGATESGACRAAATRVTQALQARRTDTTDLIDPTNIQLRVGVDRAARAASAPTAIYLCGHVIDDQGRLFLLPSDYDPAAGASLPTQSILLKAALDPVIRHGGVIMGDLRVTAASQETASADLAAMVEAANPAAHVMLAWRDEKSTAAPTLAEVVQGDILTPDWEATRTYLQAHADGTSLTLLHAPTQPAPSPPPATATVTPVAAPAKPPAAPLAAAQPPTDPFPLMAAHPDVAPASPPPSRDAKSEARREARGHTASVVDNQRTARLQIALHARGLYNGAVTGVENPALRDAIRAYQANEGHRSTGRMTSAEVVLLLSGR